jgi:hypothetical protein
MINDFTVHISHGKECEVSGHEDLVQTHSEINVLQLTVSR